MDSGSDFSVFLFIYSGARWDLGFGDLGARGAFSSGARRVCGGGVWEGEEGGLLLTLTTCLSLSSSRGYMHERIIK